MPDETKEALFEPRTVPADMVVQLSGIGGGESVKDLKRLTPTQQAGLILAGVVGFAIFCVIVFVAVVWFQSAPRPPTFATVPNFTNTSTAQATLASYQAVNKDIIDNYKALDLEAVNRVTSLFDLMATKTLVPIFTAILGYIFGSRAMSKNRTSSGDE